MSYECRVGVVYIGAVGRARARVKFGAAPGYPRLGTHTPDAWVAATGPRGLAPSSQITRSGEFMVVRYVCQDSRFERGMGEGSQTSR